MPRSTSLKRRNKPASIVATAFAAMVLSFGLLFGVQYVDKQQNIRPQAAVGQSVRLRYSGQTVSPGELRVDMFLNSDAYAVAGTQVKLKLSGTAAHEVTLNLSNSLYLDTIGSKITDQSGLTVIEFTQFASIDPNKPATTHGQEVKIGSFTIRRSQGGNFTLTTDSKTAIPVVGNSAITLDATQSQNFTLAAGNGSNGGSSSSPQPQNKKTCNQGCGGDSECQTGMVCYKGYCRGTYDREDSTCRGIGDQGIHRGCNEYCADKNECGSGYACYFNQCRNPKNLGNTSCSGPASPRPRVIYVAPTETKGGLNGETEASPTPSPSPSPTPSPSPSPSPTYDEDSFRVSPSPTIRKPSPAPVVVKSQSTGSNKLLTAGIIALFALGIVIPVGIYLYRRVR